MEQIDIQNILVFLLFIYAAYKTYMHFYNAATHKDKSSSCDKCSSKNEHKLSK